ncbi:HCP-like protein [Backusella circina FSU 941]|nr:HCP-like protein [Backusella circina FSU 941]
MDRLFKKITGICKNDDEDVLSECELPDKGKDFHPETLKTISSEDIPFQFDEADVMEELELDDTIIEDAIAGNSHAQLTVGKAYFSSIYLENNCFKAFKWIQLSAEQGNMEAQFRLADLYALGQGPGFKDHHKAYEYYTKSALQGYKKALTRIHNHYQNDVMMHCRGQLNKDEEEWDNEDFKTKNNIRELNEYRLEQLKPILNGAMDYYTEQFRRYQSINEPEGDTLQNIGFLYQHGYGVKKYNKRAIELYKIAADFGYTDAKYNLGCLYEYTPGIKFHYRKAFACYVDAAEGGNIAAQKCLAHFYEKGLGTQIDYESAFYWYIRSARAGNTDAQLNLGRLYRKGIEGFDQDYMEAAKWYMLAAQQGNSVAQNCLDQLYQNGFIVNEKYEIKDQEEDDDDDEEDEQEDEEKMEEKEELAEPNYSQFSITPSMKRRLHSKLRLDISHMADLENIETLKVLAKHALVGDGNGMYQIGLKYYSGEDFVLDQDIGFKWIHNAAKAELPEAKIKIAEMYAEGDAVEQNYYIASLWCKKSTKKRNGKAQCNLGILYDKGLGVRKDPLEASKWFELSADQGNSEAQFELGLLRYYGRGLSQSYEEAIEWYRLSAIKGNVDAFYVLGQLFWNGLIFKEDKRMALKMFTWAARQGSSSAQYRLGGIYEEGIYIKRDLIKAKLYRNQSVESGNKNSQYKMACKYLKGKSVELDYIKAFDLFKKAADQGHSKAKLLFEVPINCGYGMYNYNKIMEMFISVSEQNIASLEFNIGYTYENGIEKALTRDYQKAVKWYFKSGAKGDPRAHLRLGIMYEEGRGLIKSFRAAIYYYRKACEKREGDAMYRLGCIYLDGRGLTQNVVMAFHLFTQAADMDHKDASKALLRHLDNTNLPLESEQDENYVDYPLTFSEGEIPIQIKHENQMLMLKTMAREEGFIAIQYQLGNLFESRENPEEAFTWYVMASNGGITDAIYRLGTLYEDGRGVSQDYEKAVRLYEYAGIKDHEDALYRLAQMYLYSKGVELDYLKAYDLYKRASELGHTLSYGILNITEESSPKEKQSQIILMCEYVAENGNVSVQYELGVFYEKLAMVYLEAFKWYTIAADNEHKEAQYRLGRMYEKGLGIDQDYNKAIELYNLAKEQGSSSAIYRLGTAYHHGYGVETNPEKAFECYLTAADLGHAGSQYVLGRLYENGELVEKSLFDALKWYTCSYLQGNTNVIPSLYDMYDDEPYEFSFYQKLFQILFKFEKYSKKKNDSYKEIFGRMCFKLGTMYKYGLGVEKDEEEALKYFTRSYNKYGYSEAKEYITVDYDSENPDKENDLFKRLETYDMIRHDIGRIQQYQLGMVYYNGILSNEEVELNVDEKEEREIPESNRFGISQRRRKRRNRDNKANAPFCPAVRQPHQSSSFVTIVPKDYTKACQYLTLSAEKGYLDAQAQLGDMYLHGHGVEQSRSKAITWFKLSAKQMDKEDCYELGKAYHDDIDFEISFIYFKRAAEEGHRDAQRYLGDMYRLGRGVSNKDYSQAIEWYTKIANDLENNIAYYLGTMYHAGSENIQHFSKALKWYKKMKIRNKGYSLRSIGLLYEYGDGVQQDYLLALRYYKMAAKFEPLGGFYNLGLMYFYGKGVSQNYGKSYKWFSRVMKRSKNPNNEVTHVFVRDHEEGRVYSLETESVFHEESSYYLTILRANRKRNVLKPRNTKRHFKTRWSKQSIN